MINFAIEDGERPTDHVENAVLAGTGLFLAYFAIGGLLTILQSEGGAYFDADPKPYFYFAFYGEVTNLLSLMLWPVLGGVGGAILLSAGARILKRCHPGLRPFQATLVVAGAVGQIAWFAIRYW